MYYVAYSALISKQDVRSGKRPWLPCGDLAQGLAAGTPFLHLSAHRLANDASKLLFHLINRLSRPADRL